MISRRNSSVIEFSMTGFMTECLILRPVVVVVSVDVMIRDVVRKILHCQKFAAEEAFGFVLLEKVLADVFQLPSAFVRESPPGPVGFDSVQSSRIFHNFFAIQLSVRFSYRLRLAMIRIETNCASLLFCHEFSTRKYAYIIHT